MKIHVTGASGSGTTTLGAALKQALRLPHFDADAYTWVPTDPPFTQMRSNEERKSLLQGDLNRYPGWVLSGGGLNGWGAWTLTAFSHVVFLEPSVEVRLERLRKRERALYGEGVLPGGRMHRQVQQLLYWARAYDQRGVDPTIRNREMHEKWLAKVSCPVLRLSGELATPSQVSAVLQALG
jgi:adenylate kinase family enzyme